MALDARVMLVAAGISILTGVLFGLLPALQAATGRSLSLLRSSRVTGAAATRTRTRQMLLLAEVALALVLLAGAGLMVRTMANLLAIDPGFEASGVISAQIALPNARYTREQARAFYDAAVDRLKGVPGVASAGVHQLAAGAGLELELRLHRQRSTGARTRATCRARRSRP